MIRYINSLDTHRLDSRCRILLSRIKTLSKKTGMYHASHKWMSKEMHVSFRTVSRHIAHLKELGYLMQIKGQTYHKAPMYKVVVDPKEGGQIVHGDGGQNVNEGGQNYHHDGGQSEYVVKRIELVENIEERELIEPDINISDCNETSSLDDFEIPELGPTRHDWHRTRCSYPNCRSYAQIDGDCSYHHTMMREYMASLPDQ